MNKVLKLARPEPLSASVSEPEPALSIADDVAALTDQHAVWYHAVNEGCFALGFAQAYAFRRYSAGSRLRLQASSNVTRIDKEAPRVRWLESLVRQLGKNESIDSSGELVRSLPQKERGWGNPVSFDCRTLNCESTEKIVDDNHRFGCWAPMIDDTTIIGGILYVSDTPFSEDKVKRSGYLASLYRNQLQAIKGRGRLTRRVRVGNKTRWMIVAALAAALCIPVPLTTLSSVSVVANSPFVVAAPMNGVVESILVEPNSLVSKGDKLIALDSLELRNSRDIAERRVAVAQSEYARLSQSAIGDVQAKAGLLAAQAELELAEAEMALAQDRLERSAIFAERDGIAVYSSKRDWIGRPVQTGERILQIADPSRIAYEVELPVKDSIMLGEGRPARIYLDSDPLNAREATIKTSSYFTFKDEQGRSVYRLRAEADSTDNIPRIGVRGTAQLYGDTVPFIYVMLRRPLTAVRQWTGL